MARRWKPGDVAVVDTNLYWDEENEYGFRHGDVVRVVTRIDNQFAMVESENGEFVNARKVQGAVDDVDLISVDEGVKKGYTPALDYLMFCGMRIRK